MLKILLNHTAQHGTYGETNMNMLEVWNKLHRRCYKFFWDVIVFK